MTITTTTRLFVNQGNGVTTVFPFGFEVPDADFFSVQLQDHTTGEILEVLAPGSYILAGVGDPAGGSVTYNPVGGPISSDVDIVGIRTMPYTQETAISNQGGFYPEAIEQQLDFIVMQVQQLAEQQARSLIVNPGQTPPDLQVISEAAEAAANASANAILAGQYANYPEDSQIPGHPGEFSGLHFRNKCQAIYDALANTLAGWINAATLKTPMVDADEFGYWDSVSGLLRKLTLANLVSSIFTATRKIASANFVDDVRFWANGALTKGFGFDLALVTAGQTRIARIPDFTDLSFTKWELIKDEVLPGTLPNYDVINLANYEMVIVVAEVWPSTDSTITVRTSTDNGANYNAGGTDYGFQHIVGSATTASANSGNQSSIPLTQGNNVDNADGEGLEVTMEFFNFNKAVRGRYKATIHYELTGSSGLVTGMVGGRVNVATARNALRILCGAGNLNGKVRVYGWRG